MSWLVRTTLTLGCRYFPGGGIMMARVLYDGLVEYDDSEIDLACSRTAAHSDIQKHLLQPVKWLKTSLLSYPGQPSQSTTSGRRWACRRALLFTVSGCRFLTFVSLSRPSSFSQPCGLFPSMSRSSNGHLSRIERLYTTHQRIFTRAKSGRGAQATFACKFAFHVR